MLISNCCSARIIQDASGPDVCADCKEHCEGVEAECDCGDSLLLRHFLYDMQCDRCSYLSAKC